MDPVDKAVREENKGYHLYENCVPACQIQQNIAISLFT